MAISKTWLQELQVSIKKTVREVTLKGEKMKEADASMSIGKLSSFSTRTF